MIIECVLQRVAVEDGVWLLLISNLMHLLPFERVISFLFGTQISVAYYNFREKSLIIPVYPSVSVGNAELVLPDVN